MQLGLDIDRVSDQFANIISQSLQEVGSRMP